MAKHTFRLKDRTGKEHVYETTAFRLIPGSAVRAQIAAVVAEPLLVAFYEVMKAGDLRSLIASVADGSAASALSNVDPARIGGSLRTALQALPASMLPAILENTFRDGQMLSVEDNLDEAYERNYGELDAAIWEVVQYNGFLSLPGISLTSAA